MAPIMNNENPAPTAVPVGAHRISQLTQVSICRPWFVVRPGGYLKIKYICVSNGEESTVNKDGLRVEQQYEVEHCSEQ